MRKVLLILAYTLYAITAEAQATGEDLDSLKQQFMQETEALTAEYDEFVKQAEKEYQEYLAATLAEFAVYENNIKQIWGGDSIVYNNRTNWVEYSKDLTSRSIVDFNEGEITVEVIVDESEDAETIDIKLAQAVESLLNSRGSICDYRPGIEKAEPLTKRPVLEGLIDFSPYNLDNGDTQLAKAPVRNIPPAPTVRGTELALAQKEGNGAADKKPEKAKDTNIRAKERAKEKSKTLAERREEARQKAQLKVEKQEEKTSAATKSAVNKQAEEVGNALAEKRKEAQQKARQKVEKWDYNKENTAELAKKVVAQSKKTVTQATGKDGKKRKVAQVPMKLATNNISKQAALYKDIIAEFSKKFQIEEPLIYAVIEQESGFRPNAVSPANAYGLMQLVPNRGGTDAYGFVYGVYTAPDIEFLFNPRNNIELGTAYLHLLTYRMHLKRVSDFDCRRLCVIAAYNTGEGNVFRSFTGKISPCTNLINNYPYDKLYNHLIKNLPHPETRDYVEKVVKRREKYLKK